MTALHQTSTYNVEATINNYFKGALSALSRPSWLPNMPVVIINIPEIAANLPAFSFVHIPAARKAKLQGWRTGVGERGIWARSLLDLSVWVSRKNGNYAAQLATMQSMVESAFTDTNGVLIIKDYQANPASPQNTAYRAELDEIEFVTVTDDPNPDVLRRRALISYCWYIRSTN